MVLTGILGTVMGLNNTAAFMAGCVAFVGVALWTDSRIARRRYQAAEQDAAQQASPDPAHGPAHGPALRDDH